MRTGLLVAMALALAGCGNSNASEDGDEAEGVSAAEASDQTKGGETYNEYDKRRDSYEGSRGAFAGKGCTEDCGGHEAGYSWAEDKGITDPDDCGGKSWSFIEGCRAYAEEQEGE